MSVLKGFSISSKLDGNDTVQVPRLVQKIDRVDSHTASSIPSRISHASSRISVPGPEIERCDSGSLACYHGVVSEFAAMAVRAPALLKIGLRRGGPMAAQPKEREGAHPRDHVRFNRQDDPQLFFAL